MHAVFFQQIEAGHGDKSSHEAALEIPGHLVIFACGHTFPWRRADAFFVQSFLCKIFLSQQIEPDAFPQGGTQQKGVQQSLRTERGACLCARALDYSRGKHDALVHLFPAETAGHAGQQEQGLLRVVKALLHLRLKQHGGIAAGNVRHQAAVGNFFRLLYGRKLQEGAWAIQPEGIVPCRQIVEAGLGHARDPEMPPVLFVGRGYRRLCYGLKQLEQGDLFQR